METCNKCPVRATSLCQYLTEDGLEKLIKFRHRQKVQRGQMLQCEGEKSWLVGNVIDGVLKQSIANPDGREQTLGISFSSDFIGRPFHRDSRHTITALTDAQLCTFTRSSFDELATRHPDLAHGLLRQTLNELDEAHHWMLVLGRKTASERVATFLTRMAMRERKGDQDADQLLQFKLPFGRQEIADLLGLSIETVCREITDMRNAGIIDTRGRRTVIVLDPQALEAAGGWRSEKYLARP